MIVCCTFTVSSAHSLTYYWRLGDFFVDVIIKFMKAETSLPNQKRTVLIRSSGCLLRVLLRGKPRAVWKHWQRNERKWLDVLPGEQCIKVTTCWPFEKDSLLFISQSLGCYFVLPNITLPLWSGNLYSPEENCAILETWLERETKLKPRIRKTRLVYHEKQSTVHVRLLHAKAFSL